MLSSLGFGPDGVTANKGLSCRGLPREAGTGVTRLDACLLPPKMEKEIRLPIAVHVLHGALVGRRAGSCKLYGGGINRGGIKSGGREDGDRDRFLFLEIDAVGIALWFDINLNPVDTGSLELKSTDIAARIAVAVAVLRARYVALVVRLTEVERGRKLTRAPGIDNGAARERCMGEGCAAVVLQRTQ